MNWIGSSAAEQEQMLEAVGVASVDELISNVPKQIEGLLGIGPGLSEPELIRKLTEIAARNSPARLGRSFLGAGAYEHAIPATVDAIISRGEYFTAYTPYQAEASQGTLTWTFEFQSMVAEIMGLDAANASMYDGPSALAEAALLAMRHTKRRKVLVSGAVHPEWRETLSTYLSGIDAEIVVLPVLDGVTDSAAVLQQIDDQTACIAVQSPNFYGQLEDIRELADAAHENGALAIAAVNPLSLGVVAPPGEMGADIAVAEAQPLGIALNYGGPYAGLLAVRQQFIKQMPGRLVGMAWDARGRRGFTLTLQAREQHIRREKATSNICTNQALLALCATVYLSLVGKEGFREISRQNLALSHWGADHICRSCSVDLAYPGPFFNEFVIDLERPAKDVSSRMLQRGYWAGVDMGAFGSNPNHLMVAITETKTRADIEDYAAALREVIN